jgi:hypothetical protein
MRRGIFGRERKNVGEIKNRERQKIIINQLE